MNIAVVHNKKHDSVINRFGRPCPERYSVRQVQMVADTLRQGGHNVTVLPADVTLFDTLRQFLSADEAAHGREDASTADPPAGLGATEPSSDASGMVFNMSYGIQGDARYTHLPAMLELAGVPYTGSNPLGHALALDKVITKILLIDVDVPTPAYCVLGGSRSGTAGPQAIGDPAGKLRFPLVVKPRHESTSYGLRLTHSPSELDDAVQAIVREYQQEALVEEYIDGREVCIGLLGNDPIELLPPVELDFGNRELRLMTWDDKYHKRMDEPSKVCPAALEPSVVQRLNELAVATFRACHLRDYARVDFRIDREGNPLVLEVNSMASLGEGGSFVVAAKAAGYTLTTLVNRIVEIAHCRHIGSPLPDRTDVRTVVIDGNVMEEAG